jgi:hypothetical protein
MQYKGVVVSIFQINFTRIFCRSQKSNEKSLSNLNSKSKEESSHATQAADNHPPGAFLSLSCRIGSSFKLVCFGFLSFYLSLGLLLSDDSSSR